MNNINAKATDTLTRDNAAQMIFNALFANTVEPKYAYDMGTQYVSEYTKGNTLGYNAYGLVKVTATVNGISDGKATLTDIKPEGVTGLNALVNNKIAATPDVVGTSVVLYVKGTLGADGKVASVSELYSTSLATGATVVLGTSTNGASIANLTTKSNPNYISAVDEGASYFVNGESVTIGSDGNYNDVAALSKAQIVAGSIVEFIDTDNDNSADIVKITKKDVDFVTGNVTTRTKDDVLQVNIPGVLTWTDASQVSGYENLANGDVVLTVKVGTVTYIEKATVVEGTISSRNSDRTITVNGAKYSVSGLTGTNYALVAADKTDFVNTYKFYLDNGSNIVSAKQVTEETADQYAVVLDIVYIEGTVSAGTTAKGYAEAQVLYTDGTTEVKKVASIDGNTPVAATTTAGTVDSEKKTVEISTRNEATALENTFYTYSVNANGALVLTTAANSTKTVSGKVESGKPQFSAGTAIANSATVFLVKAGNKYSVYTGIANLPNGTAGKNYDVIDGNNGIVSYVYMEMTVSGTTATDYAYVTNSVFGTSYNPDTKETTYIFNAVVNGEETTISANATAKDELKKAAGLYTVTYTDNVVTTASKVTGKAITAVGGGVLQLADTDTVYTYDANTVVYLFEDNALSSVGTGNDLAATPEGYTDSVSVATVREGSAQLAVVYIVRSVAG
uniref:S-layer homology domain-containing protein n=1 Tax=uncultured Pseudoflavonifractor sp. TaxID=1221379 RepID=UPI002600599C